MQPQKSPSRRNAVQNYIEYLEKTVNSLKDDYQNERHLNFLLAVMCATTAGLILVFLLMEVIHG